MAGRGRSSVPFRPLFWWHPPCPSRQAGAKPQRAIRNPRHAEARGSLALGALRGRFKGFSRLCRSWTLKGTCRIPEQRRPIFH